MTNQIIIRDPGSDGSTGDLGAVVSRLAAAGRMVALTGAGVSVESGIPDFRSPGGLWEVFDPMEYATLGCFLEDPDKAWELYRALGRVIAGKEPNPAHRALADLEARGLLAGIITQNIDGLHQAAGSRTVLEIHGEHANLQCLSCGGLEPFRQVHLEPGPAPRCVRCAAAMKPNVVLFDEAVRELDAIERLLAGCDVLLVAGTSAEVYPASALPWSVLRRGGSVIEFNVAPTRLTMSGLGPGGALVEGPVGVTLPAVAARVLQSASAG